jgi:hypothetical protein
MSEEKAKASGHKPRSFLRNYVYRTLSQQTTEF